MIPLAEKFWRDTFPASLEPGMHKRDSKVSTGILNSTAVYFSPPKTRRSLQKFNSTGQVLSARQREERKQRLRSTSVDFLGQLKYPGALQNSTSQTNHLKYDARYGAVQKPNLNLALRQIWRVLTIMKKANSGQTVGCVPVANGVISPSEKDCAPKKYTPDVQDVLSQFSKNIILLPPSDHVRLLQTVLRNRYSCYTSPTFIKETLQGMNSYSTRIAWSPSRETAMTSATEFAAKSLFDPPGSFPPFKWLCEKNSSRNSVDAYGARCQASATCRVCRVVLLAAYSRAGPSSRTDRFARPTSHLAADCVRPSSVTSLNTSKSVFKPRKPVYLATFNVRSLKQAGQQVALARTLDSLSIDVCCLTETRTQDASTVIELTAPSLSSRFRLRTSGDAEAAAAGYAGVGIVLSERAEASLLDWIPVDSRLCAVRLATSVRESRGSEVHRTLFIVSAYAPTDCSSESAKDSFYDALGQGGCTVPVKENHKREIHLGLL
ncbi:hypothetical protein CLF_105051 [Clonorchis sinensis]|uniref:Endonuclease/exonuclease/phosphatase domain-containing protein n=1 Tax=Clonorchis sinensis TaxID=79923 RepID=G7YCW2_CLOSI|nr:hypothetical protein CLF_105051 [Clonorchis sinensis]